MTSLDPGMRAPERGARPTVYQEETNEGWLLLAGIMMVIVGVLNVIYGIAAIGNSSFFVNDQKYILSNLNTWGWVTLIFGALKILAAFSIWREARGRARRSSRTTRPSSRSSARASCCSSRIRRTRASACWTAR
jgi:hypothetical protein